MSGIKQDGAFVCGRRAEQSEQRQQALLHRTHESVTTVPHERGDGIDLPRRHTLRVDYGIT